MTTIRAVLFDLDGTLLDTAPDLVHALNQLREQQDLPPLAAETVKPIISMGSNAMLKLAFGISENDINFNKLKNEFLAFYYQHIADATTFFPGVEHVLTQLEQQRIPWGIVTNKHTKYTNALLTALHLDWRPACVISGDSLPSCKPDPAPLLHACELLEHTPKHCLYVGDAIGDVTASKAAGIKSLVALYGYINQHDDPYAWQADGYINQPLEILDWLAKYPQTELS